LKERYHEKESFSELVFFLYIAFCVKRNNKCGQVEKSREQERGECIRKYGDVQEYFPAECGEDYK